MTYDKEWAEENVAHWLNNDLGLYSIVRENCRKYLDKEKAAKKIYWQLRALGAVTTPDGARYSVHAIKEAI